MKTGIVKFYIADKGYGFIINDEDKADIFVHAKDLNCDIEKDMRVSFDIEEGKRGLIAKNVNEFHG
jgi:cold shock protein